MSIDSVEKSWSRSGAENTSQDGRTFSLRVFEGWQVTHSADATDLEIMAAPRIALRDKHSETYTFCTRINLPQRLGPIFSVVLIEYEGEIGPGGVTDSPLNIRPKYVWSSESSTELIDEDFDGNPIVTVNDEPINGVTTEVADQVLTVTRNFAAFSPHLTQRYLLSVNSDIFAGYPPGVAKFMGYTAESQDAPTFTYWRVQARIKFRYPYRVTPDKAWYARVRHEGFKVAVKGKKVNAPDGFRSVSVRPVLLETVYDIPTKRYLGREQRNSNQAEWLLFKRYQPLPYKALGLL